MKLQQMSQVQACKVSQFLGKLSAASQAMFLALLYYRHLEGDLHKVINCSGQDYNAMVSTSMRGTGLVADTLDNLRHCICVFSECW